MAALSIKNKTSEVAKKGPWGMVKDFSYRVYNMFASPSGAGTQEITKLGAKTLNYGYHGIVKGIGENLIKNLKGSYRDGMIKEDAFSLTKAGRKKGNDRGGKYFGWLTGGALAVGGMALAPWHPLKRTYEAGANIISQFGLSTSHAYTNAVDMNLATAEYIQRASERQVDGSWGRAGEGRSDWWSTLKSDRKKITREPSGTISNGGATAATAGVALSADAQKTSHEAIKKMEEETMTAQSALAQAQKELLEAQKIAGEAVSSHEQLVTQNKSLQEALAKKQVDEVKVTDVIDDTGTSGEETPTPKAKEKLSRVERGKARIDRRLGKGSSIDFVESDTKTLSGDYDYKIITGGLGTVSFDDGVIKIPSDISDASKDDVIKNFRKLQKGKKVGFSEEAARLLLDKAPAIFKHYLGDADIKNLQQSVKK